MNSEKGKTDLRIVEIKVLVAIYELSVDGFAPSLRGLLAFLRGDDSASRFEGLWSYGSYVSMSGKRLGMLLKGLKDFGYVDSEFEQKEEYLYLFPEGKEAARTYLAKDHRRSRPPRHGAPLFLPIR